MTTLYAKKLVSLSPNKYEYVNPHLAWLDYLDWIKNWILSMSKVSQIGNRYKSPKSFNEWLETEI